MRFLDWRDALFSGCLSVLASILCLIPGREGISSTLKDGLIRFWWTKVKVTVTLQDAFLASAQDFLQLFMIKDSKGTL